MTKQGGRGAYCTAKSWINFAEKSGTLDIFERIRNNRGPLGQHSKESHGYFTFPKLEGELGAHMTFRGKPVLVWSLNNYLGLANDPEVRKADADAAAQWGMAYPMGARMMSGQTKYHEQLEQELAQFMGKEDAFLLNYGYQGCMSAIEALAGRHDVIVYDSECHACMVDGVRLHHGKRFVFQHNDMESFEKMLRHAKRVTDETGGGILVLTEGVFGMAGDQGKLKEIAAFKKQYGFRLFVDDAPTDSVLSEQTAAARASFRVSRMKLTSTSAPLPRPWPPSGHSWHQKRTLSNSSAINMRSQTFAKALPLPDRDRRAQASGHDPHAPRTADPALGRGTRTSVRT
jgi:glycine C-acetyltransferase